MAQAFLEPFTVPGMDSQQTAVAVQSLLESQTIGETTPVDDDDIFQCGKCKKQFTSLAAFVNHKQNRCVTQKTLQQINSPNNGSVSTTALLQSATKGPQILQTSLPAYSAVTPSSLTQLPQNMVLTDDLMSFANVDQTLGASTIQLQGATLQPAGPFLSQVATFTSRSPNNVTILSPVNSSATLPSSGSAFTSTVSANQIQLHSVPHQITLTTIPEKPIAPNVGNIAKPSPTKAGRKSAQASLVTVVSADNASIVKFKRGKNGSLVVDDKKKLRCTYCDKAFAKNFDLQQHIRAHTGEKPFQCIVCGRAFAQKSNVKKHMSTHKVWPSGAGSTLPSQPLPVLVEETVPPEDSPQPEGETTTLTDPNLATVVQTIPEIPSVSQGSPVVVENVGTGETITIPTQNVNVPTEPLPPENRTSEEGNSGDSKVKLVVDNSYLCQYCSAKFKTYFQLKTHMVQHKNEQVYKCVMKECVSTFKELDAFLEHIKAHEEELTYRCHMCNKFFPSLYDLGSHQYTHSLYPNQGIKPGPRHFQCTKCMNKYSTPEALEHHLTTSTHKHPCPHCKKTFTCERYLRRHLPSHGSEGQFQCPTCNKRFKGEHYLKMHLLIHSGEKPFPCNICDAAFNRKDKLKRHMLIHDSTKRYKCPFKTLTGCEKEFNRPDKLKSHIITHSGIKPYKCKECGRAFGRKPHLKEHERGHRADFKYKCESCGKGFFRPKLFQSHKCQPMKLGQAHVFRPRVRRKVGRPKKRVPLESADLIESVRVENCMMAVGKMNKLSGRSEEGDNSQSDIMEEDNVENVQCSVLGVGEGEAIDLETESNEVEKEASQINKTVTPVKSKPEFCVKVSAPHPSHAVAPRFVTVHIQNPNSGSPSEIQTVHIQNPNGTNASEIQTHLLPSASSAQILTSQGENGAALQPITIIEAQPVHINCSVPVVSGIENTSGETITVQMAAVNNPAANDRISESMATMGGVVGELVPVAVAMPDNSDSLVTTQVVVTSTGSTDNSYITCPAQLDDFGTSDTDSVLQTSKSRNFIQSQTDFF